MSSSPRCSVATLPRRTSRLGGTAGPGGRSAGWGWPSRQRGAGGSWWCRSARRTFPGWCPRARRSSWSSHPRTGPRWGDETGAVGGGRVGEQESRRGDHLDCACVPVGDEPVEERGDLSEGHVARKSEVLGVDHELDPVLRRIAKSRLAIAEARVAPSLMVTWSRPSAPWLGMKPEVPPM